MGTGQLTVPKNVPVAIKTVPICANSCQHRQETISPNISTTPN